MEPISLVDLVDLGLSGILLFQVIVLWRDKKAQDDRIFRYLEEARQERHKMKSQVTAVALEQERLRNGQ